MDFKNYTENKDRGNNKTKAIVSLIDAIKSSLGQFDLNTRQSIWKDINSEKGKELMDKIIRNPKTYLSDSEFIKLVQQKK